MIKIARRGLSYIYLALAITSARFHIILGWALRRFLWLCKGAEWLRQWNMDKWRDRMLWSLKRYARYRDGEDD